VNIEFVLRVIGGMVGGLTAFQALSNAVNFSATTPLDFWLIYAICSASFGIMYVITPYITTRPFFFIRRQIYHATATDVLAAGVGLAFGLGVGALLGFSFSFLPAYFGQVMPVAASVILAYFGVTTMLAHKHEILGLLHVGGKRSEDERPDGNRSLLVDTSAIIDGRIADVARTGFLGGTLVVPRFVLDELQHVADSPDDLRRSRGRRGLEILNRLQREADCPIEISDADIENVFEVDQKLVRLARTLSCPIVTVDQPLTQSAQVQGVEVLNVNQLALAMRPPIIPGEELDILIQQEGKEFDQGVAYLEDGTMIVVDHGRPSLGKSVRVVVTKYLQTSAGRMVFARLKAEPNGHHT
jgi:uncharacterized protein YacL